jgi:hypothetical protein
MTTYHWYPVPILVGTIIKMNLSFGTIEFPIALDLTIFSPPLLHPKRPGRVTVFIANGDFQVIIEVDGETLRGEGQIRHLESHLATS